MNLGGSMLEGTKAIFSFWTITLLNWKLKLLKVDRNTKTAVFLLPSMIAERDEYVGSSPKAVGYVLGVFTRRYDI